MKKYTLPFLLFLLPVLIYAWLELRLYNYERWTRYDARMP